MTFTRSSNMYRVFHECMLFKLSRIRILLDLAFPRLENRLMTQKESCPQLCPVFKEESLNALMKWSLNPQT